MLQVCYMDFTWMLHDTFTVLLWYCHCISQYFLDIFQIFCHYPISTFPYKKTKQVSFNYVRNPEELSGEISSKEEHSGEISSIWIWLINCNTALINDVASKILKIQPIRSLWIIFSSVPYRKYHSINLNLDFFFTLSIYFRLPTFHLNHNSECAIVPMGANFIDKTWNTILT